jgi:hypothetical protein
VMVFAAGGPVNRERPSHRPRGCGG